MSSVNHLNGHDPVTRAMLFTREDVMRALTAGHLDDLTGEEIRGLIEALEG